MVTVIKCDYVSRYCEFAVDSASDISKLPTTTSAGQDNLSTIKSCCNGSIAYLSDSAFTVWTLNGETDTWKQV